MEDEIAIVCNGLPQSLKKGSTVGNLLAVKKIDPACVVVELNREIIQKEAFGPTILKNNDSIEILRFVGGG
jgi:sulfur carrier protein